jgi:Mrp family chromosome partitioning ATPase
MPDARVVSRAAPPVSPASPKRTLILAASIPAGLLLGFLFALLAEKAVPAASQPARKPQRAASPAPVLPLQRFGTGARGAPVLAEFPGLLKLVDDDIAPADHVIDKPTSAFARAIDALERRIATTSWMAPKVLAVTSPEAGKVKTNVALGLARAAARRGRRVIILDGDVRLPAAARVMGVKKPTGGGIAEVVTGSARLSSSVIHDPKSSAMLLSWGKRPQRVKQLLESRRMHELMGFLRSSCDLIIIDAPPVLVPEGADYTAFSDAVLVVASAAPKAQAETVRAFGMLESMRAPTIGVALAS